MKSEYVKSKRRQVETCRLLAEKEGFIRFAVPCILPELNCFAICRPLHHSALLSSSTGRSRARAHAPPGARFQILSHTKKQAPLVLVFWWRRRRDLNPRAGCPTYTLSRGASSASWVLLRIGGESGIRTRERRNRYRFSRPALSTTQTSLRKYLFVNNNVYYSTIISICQYLFDVFLKYQANADSMHWPVLFTTAYNLCPF